MTAKNRMEFTHLVSTGPQATTMNMIGFEKRFSALLYEGSSSWVSLTAANSLPKSIVLVGQLDISVWGQELQKKRSGEKTMKSDVRIILGNNILRDLDGLMASECGPEF